MNLARVAALALAEGALNRLLQLDPAASPRLQRNAHRVLGLHCLAPDFTLYLHCLPDRIRLHQHWEGQATVVSGPLSALLALGRAQDPGSFLINHPELSLRGDSQLLLQLQPLFQDLQPDLEALLARFIGELPAHQLGQMGRQMQQQGQALYQSLKQQGADFLREESELFAHPVAFSQQRQAIDELQRRTHQLQQRWQALQQRVRP